MIAAFLVLPKLVKSLHSAASTGNVTARQLAAHALSCLNLLLQ